jgi:hypothetical protein
MTILTRCFIAAVKAEQYLEIERLLDVELLAPTNGNPNHERSY